MTIETNLNRIADALEGILGKLSHIDQAVKPVKKQEAAPVVATPVVTASTPAPVITAPVTPPPAPVVESVTPPVPTPPAASPASVEVSQMSPEELNAALGVEFGRLNGREGIDMVMRDMGITSIHDLDASRYDELLTKVRAL